MGSSSRLRPALRALLFYLAVYQVTKLLLKIVFALVLTERTLGAGSTRPVASYLAGR